MNKIIFYLKSLKCLLAGHAWSNWADSKFVSSAERCCERCKLHHSVQYKRGGDREEIFSLAVGSNWPAVRPLSRV